MNCNIIIANPVNVLSTQCFISSLQNKTFVRAGRHLPGQSRLYGYFGLKGHIFEYMEDQSIIQES